MTPAVPDRRHRLLAYGLAAACALLVVLAVALPVAVAFGDLAAEIAALRDRLAKLQAERPNLAFLTARLAALEAGGAAGGSIVADGELAAQARLEEILAGLLAANGATEVMDRPLPAVPAGGFRTVRRAITVQAPAASLAPLLLAIEAAVPDLFVEELRVSRLGEGEAIEIAATVGAYASLAGEAPP